MSDTWTDVRRVAREWHAIALREAKGDRRAAALIDAICKVDDLSISTFERGVAYPPDVLGWMDAPNGSLKVARELDTEDKHAVIGHEIGHLKLHHDPASEVTLKPSGLGGERVETGQAKVEGYSGRERREVQADIFAGEFLCPSDWLRVAYLDGRKPADIAADLVLPFSLVLNQLIRALLLPPLSPTPPPKPPTVPIELDDSQKIAATWTQGPLLVEAGPGTGKTRTLVERIRFLLKHVQPGSILALTFSNKAADEMRERIAAVDATAAIEIWVSTFHAFGMEIIAKWPSDTGRTANFKTLDESESLELLEQNIERLPLHHFQNLYDPALELVHVLRAISRCKDECVSPEVYKAAAADEHKAALASGDDSRIEAAEKAVEIADIYAVYEELLREKDAVDFGDLVLLSTWLIQTNADVRAYIARYKRVLVDEYQDTNRASAKLLEALTENGKDVWVVADQRQSIYRFRGAQPANVAQFVKDFGGSKVALANNYRSFAPIVRTFEAFSAAMGNKGEMSGAWTATRAQGGAVTLTVAPTLSAEGEAIQSKIEELKAKGIPYREQAILARTHLTLFRITSILEQLGVPLLYLGDLFERREIRELLCLLALGAETGNVGLVRLAALPAYGASREDALAVIRWAREKEASVFGALLRTAEIEGLSPNGRAGFAKLGAEITGLEHVSAWRFLTVWLFERSDYLKPMLANSDPASQQALIAIYHFLKVCGEHAAERRRAFLGRIRRIEALNYDSTYRAVSAEAADIDAVRVMTIHGSKGLEFQAVHFPAIATRYMPSNRQWVRCPPPPTLTQLVAKPNDHDDEEKGLFFVGLSRARDYLSLSRAEKYTSVGAGPSKFLPDITRTLTPSNFQGTGRVFDVDEPLYPQPASEIYPERELDVYLRCPARYRYEVLEDLYGLRDGAPYVKFHRSVYVTIAWLEEQRAAGTPASRDEALAFLAKEWAERGPVGAPLNAYYRKIAEEMVARMVASIATETSQYDRDEWTTEVDGRLISLTPDRVLIRPDGVHVQKIRTGKKTKSEPGKPIYALMRQAASERFPGKQVVVEIYYLAVGETLIVQPERPDKEAKKLADYRDAIGAIERGEFPPDPESRKCANCQSYFLCGA